jgi:hypothetical protein
MTTRNDLPNEKQKRILEYLRTQVATQTYFKSRLIGREVGLSAKEVGTNLGAITRRGTPPDLAIERWGYSSGTTWKVTPAVSVSTTATPTDEVVQRTEVTAAESTPNRREVRTGR